MIESSRFRILSRGDDCLDSVRFKFRNNTLCIVALIREAGFGLEAFYEFVELGDVMVIFWRKENAKRSSLSIDDEVEFCTPATP